MIRKGRKIIQEVRTICVCGKCAWSCEGRLVQGWFDDEIRIDKNVASNGKHPRRDVGGSRI